MLICLKQVSRVGGEQQKQSAQPAMFDVTHKSLKVPNDQPVERVAFGEVGLEVVRLNQLDRPIKPLRACFS